MHNPAESQFNLIAYIPAGLYLGMVAAWSCLQPVALWAKILGVSSAAVGVLLVALATPLNPVACLLALGALAVAASTFWEREAEYGDTYGIPASADDGEAMRKTSVLVDSLLEQPRTNVFHCVNWSSAQGWASHHALSIGNALVLIETVGTGPHGFQVRGADVFMTLPGDMVATRVGQSAFTPEGLNQLRGQTGMWVYLVGVVHKDDSGKPWVETPSKAHRMRLDGATERSTEELPWEVMTAEGLNKYILDTIIPRHASARTSLRSISRLEA